VVQQTIYFTKLYAAAHLARIQFNSMIGDLPQSCRVSLEDPTCLLHGYVACALARVCIPLCTDTSHTNAVLLLLLLLLSSAAGISNGLLQEWPKVHKCRTALASVLELPHPEPPPAAAAANGGSSIPEPVGSSSAPAAAAAAGEVVAGGNSAGTDPAIAAAEAAAAADGELPWPVLFHHVMGDAQQVPPEQEVPLTGVGEQLDRRLSSVFIEPFEMQVGVPGGGGVVVTGC
jgi:hypothetical protein